MAFPCGARVAGAVRTSGLAAADGRCPARRVTSARPPPVSHGPEHALGQSRQGCRTSVCASAKATVVVTREAGKNGKLRRKIEQAGLGCLEMPLIETAEGPDRPHLAAVLGSEQFEWITLTSPEAAAVFLEGWAAAGQPDVRIAVVGAGTAQVLEGSGATVQFVPSKADAVTLAAELPAPSTSDAAVLYPASALAASTLQDALAGRGFSVKRLNTYKTVAVTAVEAAVLDEARQADVVTIGSPSALKAWVRLAGEPTAESMPLACIGGTSAKAAKKLGLSKVFYPEQPGVDGWMQSVHEALAVTPKASA